ncbi:tRNA-specific adenosine deaminase [Desulfovibrionales bacterium]
MVCGTSRHNKLPATAVVKAHVESAIDESFFCSELWPDWTRVMAMALTEAKVAKKAGETPVGAILLNAEGKVLARAGNSPISRHDPTAHAEILALRRAGRQTKNYRLIGSILVTTLEPCLMCLGALVHAQVAGLVYGAANPKTGAVYSRLRGVELDFLNHRFWVLPGVEATACEKLLSEFFRERRKQQKVNQWDASIPETSDGTKN